MQAGALRDLHGGSPGGARDSGDLARREAGNAPAAGHRGGAGSERRREVPTGRSRPGSPRPSPRPGDGPAAATSHTERPVPGEARRSPPPRPRASLTFTVTGPPREDEARHRGGGGGRRPGPARLSPLRSVPCAAPSALRLAAAPRSNTAPPAAARGPSLPYWLRRPARRAPIGCAAAAARRPGPSARAVLPTSCFIPQCRGASAGRGGAGRCLTGAGGTPVPGGVAAWSPGGAITAGVPAALGTPILGGDPDPRGGTHCLGET